MNLGSYRIIVKHNDWTSQTENTTVKLKHLNFHVFKFDSRLYSTTTLYIQGSIHQKTNFIKILRSRSEELKLKNIKYDTKYLEFTTPIKNTIYDYIRNFNPITSFCYVYNGLEDWIVSYENVNNIIGELKNNISNSGNVVRIEYINNMGSFIPMDYLYTKNEQKILLYAIKNGFFKNPRAIKLHEISLFFGISDAYCSKIIRASVGK